MTPMLAPSITKGDGATVTKGQKVKLSFISNMPTADMIRVELDGAKVDGKNYTIDTDTNDSYCSITLMEDYVSTLSVGMHILGIVSEFGTAKATLYVVESGGDTSGDGTGDGSGSTSGDGTGDGSGSTPGDGTGDGSGEYTQPINFDDVTSLDYFYKAVIWAAGKGITNGTDPTHFSPSASCTRAQIVTFLWRAMA